jgi:hypothetical protein
MALTTAEMETKILTIESRLNQIYKQPDGLIGLLPAVIVKIAELFKAIQILKPIIVRGYDSYAPKDSYHYWGCVVDIECTDYVQLRKAAKLIGFTWTDVKCPHSGHLEFTNELTIKDFQTFRVNGDLKLVEEVRLNKIN